MLYLLYGDSAPLQIKYEEIINKIKRESPGIQEKIFDASLNEIESFFESVSSNSMFAPKELIVLKRAEDYKNLADIAKGLKLYNLGQKEIVVIYEEFLNSYNKPTNPLGKKIITAFDELGEVICFRKENEKNIATLYVQEHLNISASEAQELMDLVGDDYFKIRNEIAKIQNFLDGERYSLSKVKPILSLNHENNLKKLIEVFLVSRESKTLIEYIKQEKIHPLFIYSITEELLFYQKLLYLLKSEKISLKSSYNNFKDRNYEDIKHYFANAYGFIHPYVLFLKINNIQLFKLERVNTQLQKLLEIEYAVKSGNADIEIEVESFILNFFN